MITLLAQTPGADESWPGAQAMRMLAESARAEGINLVGLPPDLEAAEAADLLPRRLPAGPALLSARFPGPDALWGLYGATAAQRLRLLNTPEQTLEAMRLERWYSRLERFTARTVLVRSQADAQQAFERLGSPLFVKGSIKSNKEEGWEACLVSSAEQLLARLEASPREWLAAREILPLRQEGTTPTGMPFTREYRVYVCCSQPLGMGFYWCQYGSDPFGKPDRTESAAITRLALEAAARMSGSLLAVDVGQTQTREWKVIEVGDPQFSGIAHMPHSLFWHRLRRVLEG